MVQSSLCFRDLSFYSLRSAVFPAAQAENSQRRSADEPQRQPQARAAVIAGLRERFPLQHLQRKDGAERCRGAVRRIPDARLSRRRAGAGHDAQAAQAAVLERDGGGGEGGNVPAALVPAVAAVCAHHPAVGRHVLRRDVRRRPLALIHGDGADFRRGGDIGNQTAVGGQADPADRLRGGGRLAAGVVFGFRQGAAVSQAGVRVSQLPGAPAGKGLYEIRVRDTGIGMSQEFADRIFEPFEREHTSTVSRIQGTGLGMAISKNIIDMMGGTIEVHTQRGRGTEFVGRLTLRLQEGKQIAETIAALEGLKALVVDDDYDTCDSVTKMLRRVGMRSEWTLSGKEAVLRARHAIEMEEPLRAYIIDWRLPDMNGIEVTRQIRALGDQTPIIIMTAYDWNDIEAEAKAAGVTAFCSKPLFMSDLRSTLLTAIDQMEEQDESALPEPPKACVFRGRRLLLVEDNELNREIALEILSGYGCGIETAENGAQAVERIASSRPGEFDLVLMDIQMPILDGLEATRRIRALSDPALSNVPILAMTANAFNEDRQAALDCGMNGFLSKPIDIGELIQKMQPYLLRDEAESGGE